jgi:hypothetical protein
MAKVVLMYMPLVPYEAIKAALIFTRRLHTIKANLP